MLGLEAGGLGRWRGGRLRWFLNVGEGWRGWRSGFERLVLDGFGGC